MHLCCIHRTAESNAAPTVLPACRYTESQFDSEFIEVLREACFAYLQRQGDTTLKDIAKFIRAKGFSRVDLREEDIQTIVQTLIYDGRIDQVLTACMRPRSPPPYMHATVPATVFAHCSY